MPDKFRIWDKQLKKFVEISSTSTQLTQKWCVDAETGEPFMLISSLDYEGGEFCTMSRDPGYYMDGAVCIKEPRYVLQRYTGITDKNLIPIYEGDLVNYTFFPFHGSFDRRHHEKQEVFFEEGIFYLGRGSLFATNDRNLIDETIEVCGNIFEN